MTAQIKRTARRCSVLFGAAGLLIAGFCLGHSSGTKPLAAQQPAAGAVVPVSGGVPVADTTKRPIALVYGGIPITREEFGDYLISLYADERLDLYVNKRIIEMGAAKMKIDVTPIEIEAAIDEDCRHINITKADFEKRVLKDRYHKTPTEWRNDVMKPRLLLAKMCLNRITVNETELKHMFENRYGEKAKCKIIVWPREQHQFAERQYGDLRKPGTKANPDADWDSVATKQADANLAARAGEIEPIGRHSGSESSKVEDIAFTLKVGEVSPIIELDIGFMVVKRTGTIEPVKGVDFEKLKPELYKEVVNRKLDKEVAKFFAEMREEAKPVLFIGKKQSSQPNPVATLPERTK